MEIEELLNTSIKQLALLQQMEGKEATDLIEVEVGSIYDSLIFTLAAILISHKQDLKVFFKLMEEEVPESKELLELKSVLNNIDKFERIVVYTNEEGIVEVI